MNKFGAFDTGNTKQNFSVHYDYRQDDGMQLSIKTVAECEKFSRRIERVLNNMSDLAALDAYWAENDMLLDAMSLITPDLVTELADIYAYCRAGYLDGKYWQAKRDEQKAVERPQQYGGTDFEDF